MQPAKELLNPTLQPVETNEVDMNAQVTQQQAFGAGHLMKLFAAMQQKSGTNAGRLYGASD